MQREIRIFLSKELFDTPPITNLTRNRITECELRFFGAVPVRAALSPELKSLRETKRERKDMNSSAKETLPLDGALYCENRKEKLKLPEEFE